MSHHAILIALAALGVETGWQPLENGQGLEYIIQIDRQLFESLQQGDSLTSSLPEEVRNVRQYRIVVGNDRLPRKNLAAQRTSPETPTQTERAGSAMTSEVDRPTTRSDVARRSPHAPQFPDAAASEFSQDSSSDSLPQAKAEDPIDTFPKEPDRLRPAAHVEPVTSPAESEVSSATTSSADLSSGGSEPVSPSDRSAEPAASQVPGNPQGNRVVLTTMGLFLSVILNLFLFWHLREAHRRYRETVGDLTPTSSGA